MSYTKKSVRNLADETLAVEIEAAELELSELEPRIAELRVRRGKTVDVRALYDLNLVEIDELEERWQELTEALEVLTTERNERS
jgi:predicted  nucleic acid-binding Zn-ribbon protein